jgi:hypothetical protein
MKSTIPVIVIATSLALVAATGYLHGSRTNRWGLHADVNAAGQRLLRFPEEIGPWQTFEEAELPEAVQEILQCTGWINRSYRHRVTGDLVNVALIVGPSGPMSVHVPEICYSSVDFQQDGDREEIRLEGGAGQSQRFWKLNMQSKSELGGTLRVYYGWTTGRVWEATEMPRVTFVGKDLLYKIQLASPVLLGAEGSERDSGKEFLVDFLGAWETHMRNAE